ncbi:putative 28S ribosomal protein S16, mitochondrial [Chionoecetes opilio]|uniref:Small ribosomal subunit protein bS16m n=1 Tax=Chionoecetes opilio TaxID=41210 RepID=A0A8J4YDT1_CHIOP|nr:putative 28S ribosomal protein S16, mitochondrial [Chionoecetes opilio]
MGEGQPSHPSSQVIMFPASGGAVVRSRAAKIIRFAYHGCANRPFYHIVVMRRRSPRNGHVIEQLGSYDPMENAHGEKLAALNTERITYWIGQGAHLSNNCATLLGLSGLLPIHPTSYMKAWRNRRASASQEKAEETS